MIKSDIELYYILASVIYVLLLGSILLLVSIYVKRLIRHRKDLDEIRNKNEASLLQATLTIQEKERERIGANLHDDIGPLLSSVKIFFKEELKKSQVPHREEVEAFLEALDENIEQVRDISRELVPNVLHRFGFRAAIEEVIRRFSGDNKIEFSLKIEDDTAINQDIHLPLYRIIQESINNAIRHGKADKIQVEIRTNGGLNLSIRDNGKGFNPDEIKAGLGLRNIEARAKSILANLKIISSPGKGCEIIINKSKANDRGRNNR